MMGSKDAIGLIPRISSELFITVQTRLDGYKGTEKQDMKCMITVVPSMKTFSLSFSLTGVIS
jgi:hypothetical protein